MIDPSLAVQAAIVEALRAASLDAVIYDKVPKEATFPYVSLGPSQVNQDDADCYDGFEVFAQVDVWSRQVGFVECKTIGEKIRSALHRLETENDDFGFEIEHQFSNYFRDGDGLTSHGVLSFRALIDHAIGE